MPVSWVTTLSCPQVLPAFAARMGAWSGCALGCGLSAIMTDQHKNSFRIPTLSLDISFILFKG